MYGQMTISHALTSLERARYKSYISAIESVLIKIIKKGKGRKLSKKGCPERSKFFY